MPDLMTICLVTVLTSLMFAALVGYWGREYWREGTSQIMVALLFFGGSFVCMTFVASPHSLAWFLAGYTGFAVGIGYSISALLVFNGGSRTSWPPFVMFCLTAVAYAVFLDSQVDRIRTVSALFLLGELYILVLLLRSWRVLRSRGTWLFMGSMMLVSGSMVLRLFYPSVALAMRTADDGGGAILTSYVTLLAALQMRALGFLWMCRDRAELQLRHYADEDALTGLANRRVLLESLRSVFREGRTGAQMPLSILMLDIDYFKRINDVCGHASGDAVLVDLSEVLLRFMKAHYFVGRYGGEEFVVICPKTGESDALLFAEVIRHEVMKNISVSHATDSWPITVSIGVYTCVQHSHQETHATLMQKADEALYVAKRNGRNRVCAYGTSAGEPVLI